MHVYILEKTPYCLTPALKPFYHGVASGDPLQDRVILWTRISPDTLSETIPVSWEVATDTAMEQLVASGDTVTHASRDYTVKVDVEGLSTNTTYYYRFQAQGRNSLVGRTKTAPVDESHLRFAVVSCSNYEAGYFNAYGRVADRNDLHAVIHLGDYIYEYETGIYGDSLLQTRRHQDFEPTTLEEYRARYSLYRLDEDLRRAHQQHPFINVWDDHESANDAWKDGAENHTEGEEGSWELRKSMARKAFFEWLPIRDTEDSLIYRTLSYGNLMDLILLDTRLEGRTQQPGSVLDDDFLDPERTILGETQKAWFKSSLENSTATWKIIGNQVIFAPLYVGWAGSLTGDTPEEAESIFLDIWDGYPLERLELVNFLRDNSLDNVVFLSGDFHSSFAFDVADTVVNPQANYAPVPNYDAETGEGSVAVEFVTPSITSANFDENLDAVQSALFERAIKDGDNFFINPPIPSPNPHLKFVDLDRHGYVLLDVKPDSVQANWYFVARLDTPSIQEEYGAGQLVRNGENHLRDALTESAQKEVQDIPSPQIAPNPSVSNEEVIGNDLALFSVFPNPADNTLFLLFGTNQRQPAAVEVVSMEGKRLMQASLGVLTPGIYRHTLEIGNLPSGIYGIQIRAGNRFQVRTFVKK